MEKIETDNNSGRITMRFRQVFLVAFATIALLMTAYATSGGLRLFLSEPYAWIGITALAVGFLAFTSLVIGDGISSNKISQVVLVSPFFLIAVAICWILSFTSYHQQFLSVGKSDLANSETNLRQMGIYAHDVTKAMNDQLDVQRASLTEGNAFKQYSTGILGLSDDLRSRGKKEEIASQLKTLIETKRVELINRQAKMQADEGKLRNDLERLSANINRLEKLSSQRQTAYRDALALVGQVELALKLEEGDTSIPVWDRPYLERDGLARQLVDAAGCNRRRASGKGSPTPGPCYSALTEKLAETLTLVDESKKAVDATLVEVKEARQSQTEKQTDLKELMAQFEADKLQSSAGFASEFQQDTNNFLKGVNTFIDQPTEASFKSIAGYCKNVTGVLSDLTAISELPACEPQALTVIFKQFNTFDEEQRTVNLACEESAPREKIIENLRRDIRDLNGQDRLVPITRSYDTMRSDVLEECLVVAEQNGLATSEFRSDLSNFYDQINPSQDPISKAIGKVTSLFNGTASARDYFPALLALLQELSLLLSKLFWDATVARKSKVREDEEDYSDLDLEAKPDDPMPILAAKNLLLNTTFHKQKHLLPQIFDEEYSHQMRSHMRHSIENLFRKKLARKSSRGVVISDDGIAEISRQIIRHNQSVKLAKVEPTPVVSETVPVEVKDTRKAPALAVVNVPKMETQLVTQDTIVDDSMEITAPEIEEVVEEAAVPQRPRKRRPVVVRPNFRHEV